MRSSGLAVSKSIGSSLFHCGYGRISEETEQLLHVIFAEFRVNLAGHHVAYLKCLLVLPSVVQHCVQQEDCLNKARAAKVFHLGASLLGVCHGCIVVGPHPTTGKCKDPVQVSADLPRLNQDSSMPPEKDNVNYKALQSFLNILGFTYLIGTIFFRKFPNFI